MGFSGEHTGASPHPLGTGALGGLARVGRGITPGNWVRMGHPGTPPPQPIWVSLSTRALSPTIIQRPLEDRGPAGDAVAHPGEGQHADLVQRVFTQPGQLGTAGGIALRQPEPSLCIRLLLLVHHLQQTPWDTATAPGSPPPPQDGAAWPGLAPSFWR